MYSDFIATSNVVIAATINVDDSGGKDFRTIQEAIENVPSSEAEKTTILVYPGTYVENVYINGELSGLTIESESGPDNTIVLADDPYAEVFYLSPRVTLNGFTIKGGQIAGIFSNSEGYSIQNNKIEENGFGLALSKNGNVMLNNISSNGVGILVSCTMGTYLDQNIIILNGVGISLNSADYSRVMNNVVKSNNVGIDIIDSYHCNIYNNIFDNSFNVEYSDVWNYYDNEWNTDLTESTNIIGGSKIGGNYWSDYYGWDDNGDGIGESPYFIKADNFDYYPLTFKLPPEPPVVNILKEYGNYYCEGRGYKPNSPVDIYIAGDWTIWAEIGDDLSDDGINTVLTNDLGDICKTKVCGNTLPEGDYFVLVDTDQDGIWDDCYYEDGTCNGIIDGVSWFTVTKEVSNVPEFTSIALPIVIVISLAFLFQRRKL